MRVYLADYDAPIMGYWAALYPDKIGWLIGPTSRRMKKVPHFMEFACDNDRFIAWDNDSEWNEEKYWEMLSFIRQSKRNPKWVLVPDVVANKNATLESWYHFMPRIKEMGFTLAFAVQDGMTPCDVPPESDIVFVGGTTDWKWRNAKWFCESFARVHVGRVGTIGRLRLCESMGAESIDGTGWFRDGEDNFRLLRLETFLKGEPETQTELLISQ